MSVLLPKYINDRNENNQWTVAEGQSLEEQKLDSKEISFIIGAFFVACIINSPFNSKIKNALGSRNAIMFGFTEMIISSFGLGLASRCQDPTYFFYSSMILRFFQGQGNGIIQFSSYTIITGLYSDDLLKYMSYIELSVGLGFGLGPFFGGLVSPYLHYEKTMYFFACMILGGMAVCYFLMPRQLN